MAKIDDALESALGVEQFNVAENLTLIDPDTLAVQQDDNEWKLRLKGAGGPETTQIDEQGTIKKGEAGGQLTHEEIAHLMREGNLSQVVKSGEEDPFGRQLGDVINPETGESLIRKGLESGVLSTSRYSSRSQSDLSYLGQAELEVKGLHGKLDAWDEAAMVINSNTPQRELVAKPTAANPMEFARYGGPQAFSDVSVVQADRYYDNKSKSWLGMSGRVGLDALYEGGYGAMNMMSKAFSDGSGYGEAGLSALEVDRANQASTDFLNPFDQKGNWKLDSVGDYGRFIIGTAITSAPYMAVTMASMMAAPFTGFTSLSIPATLYAGNTWAEMDEEDRTVDNIPTAMLSGAAQGALDVLGVGSFQVGKRLFTNPTVKKKIIDELAEVRGIDKVDAENLLARETKRQLASMSEAYKTQLKKNLMVGRMSGMYAINLGVGAAGEAVTEASQELIGMVAARGWDETFNNQDELQRRLVTAAVGGGFLGFGFTAGGVATDIGTNYDALKSYEQTTAEQLETDRLHDLDKQWQTETGQGDGSRVRSKAEVIQHLTSEADANGFGNANLEEMAGAQAKTEQGKGAYRKLRDYFKNRNFISGFTQGYIDTLRPEFGNRGRVMSGLFESWGSGRGLTGANAEEAFATNKAFFGMTTNNGVQDQARFKMSEKKISRIFRDPEVVKVLKDVAGKFNSGKYNTYADAYKASKLNLPTQYQGKLNEILAKAEELETMAFAVAKKTGKKYSPGSFYDYRPYDKDRMEREREALRDQIQKDTGLSGKEANDAIEQIILDDEVNSANVLDQLAQDPTWDDPNVVGELVQSDLARVREAMSRPEYAHYKNDDLYYSQELLATDAARQMTDQNFGGREGNNVAAILQLAHKRGEINKDEMDYLAWEFNDAAKIRQNQYNMINPMWRKFQNNLMFMSTIAILPLATLSSLVETGVLKLGMSPEESHKLMKPLVKNLSGEFVNWMNWGANSVGLVNRQDLTQSNFTNKGLNKGLGFEDTSASARARQEASEGGGLSSQILDAFFKGIFLQPWTNTMRMTSAAMGGDVIFGWMNNVMYDVKEGKETVLGRESKEALAELGIPVDDLVHLSRKEFDASIERVGQPVTREQLLEDNEAMQRIDAAIREGLYSFVIHRVAQPSKVNRPKLYYDPRFRMFFHFQGFISSFTSQILPKIYKNLVRGTPGLKYNAVSTILSMMLMAFLSQWLKDEVKYGEPSPWLNDWQKFQRVMYSSGLLGTAERAINLVHPLYSNRYEGPLETVFNRTTGEAPAVDYALSTFGSLTDIAQGDIDKGVRGAARSVPGLGPFYSARYELGEMAEDIFGD